MEQLAIDNNGSLQVHTKLTLLVWMFVMTWACNEIHEMNPQSREYADINCSLESDVGLHTFQPLLVQICFNWGLATLLLGKCVDFEVFINVCFKYFKLSIDISYIGWWQTSRAYPQDIFKLSIKYSLLGKCENALLVNQLFLMFPALVLSLPFDKCMLGYGIAGYVVCLYWVFIISLHTDKEWL